MPGLLGPGGLPLAAGLHSILLAGTAVAGLASGTSGGSYAVGGGGGTTTTTTPGTTVTAATGYNAVFGGTTGYGGGRVGLIGGRVTPTFPAGVLNLPCLVEVRLNVPGGLPNESNAFVYTHQPPSGNGDGLYIDTNPSGTGLGQAILSFGTEQNPPSGSANLKGTIPVLAVYYTSTTATLFVNGVPITTQHGSDATTLSNYFMVGGIEADTGHTLDLLASNGFVVSDLCVRSDAPANIVTAGYTPVSTPPTISSPGVLWCMPLNGDTSCFTGATQTTTQGGGSSTATANAITAPTPGSALTPNGYRFKASNGKELFLAGPHTWPNMQDTLNSGNGNTAFDFTTFINWFAGQGWNFLRGWALSSAVDVGGAFGNVSPMPWTESGGKFNLTSLNQSYFDRVLSRVQACAVKSVYLSVMAFDATSFAQNSENGSNSGWNSNPFNSANNSNGIDGSGGGSDGLYCFTQTSGAIWNVFTALVDKLATTLSGQSNVVAIEVLNELPDTPAHRTWYAAMVSYIKGKGFRVIASAMFPPAVSNPDTNSWLAGSSGADAYSIAGTQYAPDGSSDNYLSNNEPVASGSLPVFFDTDHVEGAGGDRQHPLYAFFDGYAGFLSMDTLLSGAPTIAGLMLTSGDTNAAAEADVRVGMSQVMQLAALVDLTGCVPATLNGNLALYNPSTGVWLVYMPSGGSPVLNLSGYGEQLVWRKLDVSGGYPGTVSSAASVAQNGSSVQFALGGSASVLIVQPGTVSGTVYASGSLSPLATTGTVGTAISFSGILANTTTAWARLRAVGGNTDLLGPVQVTASNGSFSGTLTPAAAATDNVVLTLDQAGTQVLYTSAPIAVAAAQQGGSETIALASPGAQTAGDSFAVSGTISDAFAANPLAIVIDGGTPVTMGSGAPYALAVQVTEVITLAAPASPTAGTAFAVSGTIVGAAASPTLALIVDGGTPVTMGSGAPYDLTIQ